MRGFSQIIRFCKSLKFKSVTKKSLIIVENNFKFSTMEEKKENIININGTDYKLKKGLRAVIAFETITKKAFEIKNTSDVLAYIYAAIVAADPETTLEFEKMIDAFDEDQKTFEKAMKIVMSQSAAEHIVQISNEGGPEPKKE